MRPRRSGRKSAFRTLHSRNPQELLGPKWSAEYQSGWSEGLISTGPVQIVPLKFVVLFPGEWGARLDADFSKVVKDIVSGSNMLSEHCIVHENFDKCKLKAPATAAPAGFDADSF